MVTSHKGDKAVFITALLAAAFLLGMWAGTPKQIKRVCPVVAGVSPVATATTDEGEFCYYQPAIKGRSVRKVKL